MMKKTKLKNISFQATADVHAQIRRAAAAEQRTPGVFIRRIVEEALTKTSNNKHIIAPAQ